MVWLICGPTVWIPFQVLKEADKFNSSFILSFLVTTKWYNLPYQILPLFSCPVQLTSSLSYYHQISFYRLLRNVNCEPNDKISREYLEIQPPYSYLPPPSTNFMSAKLASVLHNVMLIIFLAVVRAMKRRLMETDWWVEEKVGRCFSTRLSEDDCWGGGEEGQKWEESGGN